MGRPDPHTEKLLALSVEQYRELLQNAENLLKVLDACDYSQLDKHTNKLLQLQAAAKEQDEYLLPLLLSNFTVWKETELYQTRMTYIQSNLKLNELIEPKVRGMMAVTSAELKKMSGCRTALSGYSTQSSRHRTLRGIG